MVTADLPPTDNLRQLLLRICDVSVPVPACGYDAASAVRRADVFAQELRRLGYPTTHQVVHHRGNSGVNILGGAWHQEGAVWLSAHNDYHGGLGAADNGTALVVLAEVARLLAASQHQVAFASFCFEEQGLAGARHFVEQNTNTIPRIGAFLNLECLGIRDWRTVVVTRRGRHVRSDGQLVKLLRRCSSYRPMICPSHYVGDSIPFQKAGVPVAELMGYYFDAPHRPVHTEQDTIECVDFDELTAVVQTIVRFVTTAALVGGNVEQRSRSTHE